MLALVSFIAGMSAGIALHRAIMAFVLCKMSKKRWEGGCSRWDVALQLYGIDFGGGLFGSWFLPT